MTRTRDTYEKRRFNELIGQRIQDRRRQLGMSKAKLASTMSPETSVSSIYNWESNAQSPSLVSAAPLARALGWTLNDLVDGIEIGE